MDTRAHLSSLIVEFAEADKHNIVLSGDHGYALFDAIRSRRAEQFINVGVMEQAMIGIAAGLARTGFRPIVYGLSAFVPIRVLEQIKLDICYSRLPVIFLGDGAGVVYSTLGSSHHCGEDIAALRALPNIRIYSPADAYDLETCFREAWATNEPCYIRIGKSDRPAVNNRPPTSSDAYSVGAGSGATERRALVSMGSMLSLAKDLAQTLGWQCIAVPRLKPLGAELARSLAPFQELIVLEEHSRYGGLASAITDTLCELQQPVPRLHSLSLRDQFAEKCGSWQYALSEHGLADEQVRARVMEIARR